MAKAHRIKFYDLKARADFAAVLLHYRINLFGQGTQAKILCPFHDDERPSCSVNLDERLFHCFSCHVSENVLDLVHRMETRDGAIVSLRQAGLQLAELCGLETGEQGSAGRQEPRRAKEAEKAALLPFPRDRNGAPRGSKRQEEAVSSELKRNKPLGFRLTLDPEHPYLAERGIPPELAKLFGLGVCSQGSMAGRLCIAIENASGELVAYAGR